ncbi:MAG TPA: flagellar hook-length control protein FliK [Bacteriovoracaceae bacterium]|nr:flagellar hook-length control protein FliK [Bacteriovoracaceae bacterium]
MIQASKPTAVEPKAAKAPKVAEQGKRNLLSELKGSSEKKEFANELDAATSEDEVAVKPVKIADDQLLQKPSTLINNLPESNPEAVSPKVFDPALTKGVEVLNDPSANIETPVKLTNEQIMQLANGEVPESAETDELKAEISQAMLKSPQVNGRAPAIELTKAEIDPQLMNMEDFVAQKNLAAKKAMPANGYGMKPEALKSLLENNLKATEVVTEAQKADGAANKSVNSQQFILDMLKEQSQPKLSDVSHVSKVFNMSDIKSDQPNAIMTQISDYIVQAKAAKEPTVTMRMNHDELGMIDITVRKGQGISQDIAINIGTHSAEGKNFFNLNSKELFSHLSQAGISVSDIKVETPSQSAKSDFESNQQGSKQSSSGEKNFGSEQNQRRHEQDKRKELWNLLNKEAA